MTGDFDSGRMRAISAADLLEVWEVGSNESHLERPLRLLAAAFPDVAAPAFGQMTIGARDAALLAVRERTFGPELAGVSACPQCRETLELRFPTNQLGATRPPDAIDLSTLTVDDYEMTFRLPNTVDLVAVAGEKDVRNARQRLLERCILATRCRNEACPVAAVPAETLGAVVERMGELDPQAKVELALSCPQCGHQWQALFDIASFLWAEVDAWAVRTLSEVHALASMYAWREADILRMSARRRQAYLSLGGASG